MIDFNETTNVVLVLRKRNGGGTTIPFLQDRSEFEILASFIDEYGYGIGCFNSLDYKSLDLATIEAKKNIEKDYEKAREYLLSDDYLSKCQGIYDELCLLNKEFRKHKRIRWPNQDYDNYFNFQKENDFFINRCLVFDIAFFGAFIHRDPTPEEKAENPKAAFAMSIIDQKPDATMDERKDMADRSIKSSIRNECEYVDIAVGTLKHDFKRIHDLLTKFKEDIYVVHYDRSKGIKVFDKNSVIIKKEDFKIEDCAFLKTSILYILKE